jgi:hypothetical protein
MILACGSSGIELLNNLYTDKQTDLIILDFYKAFDKVPHKKLLRKLDNYSIRGKHWISAFLKNRQQRVVLDGELACGSSGIHQSIIY